MSEREFKIVEEWTKWQTFKGSWDTLTIEDFGDMDLDITCEADQPPVLQGYIPASLQFQLRILSVEPGKIHLEYRKRILKYDVPEDIAARLDRIWKWMVDYKREIDKGDEWKEGERDA